MNPLLSSIFSTQFAFAVFRVTTPLLFASLGVGISALAGTINIGLEGIMLVSAFAGVMTSAFTGNLFLSLLVGVGSGVLIAAILAYFHLKLKADIILGAVALNMFASGITVFLMYIFSGDKGSTSSLKSLVFPEVNIPLLDSIPVLGDIFSGHNILTYGAVAAVFLYYLIIFKSPLGLRIRAVGQNPDAAESVGISVDRIKAYALMLSGFFGAFGGLYLAMGYVSWFAKDMTAGRGFIAVAAATLGGNMPIGSFLASLLFGAVNAFAIYISTLKIPSDLIQLIPYLVTVIALTIYSARRLKPKVGEVKDSKELL